MRRSISCRTTVAISFALMIFAGCRSVPPRPPAPWSGPPVTTSEAPAVLVSEWLEAENRASCAPLAFDDLGRRLEGASARRAHFGGGWAVAWDRRGLPGVAPTGEPCDDCGRGVVGIAGTGVDAAGVDWEMWPHYIEWRDGSRAGYGPEGGDGPRHLAYLEVAGQDCLYNVWSFLGRDHLEFLLGELRFVESADETSAGKETDASVARR